MPEAANGLLRGAMRCFLKMDRGRERLAMNSDDLSFIGCVMPVHGYYGGMIRGSEVVVR